MKNDNKIVHVPISGGPCSAKTSSSVHIREKAMQLGIKTIFVPEAARSYFQAIGRDTESIYSQQRGIFSLQLANEAFYRKKAQQILEFTNSRVLVIYDRSLMDNKAYMPKHQWIDLMKDFSTSEFKISKRYTNPLHLVTAADGAEKFYVNDPERSESPSEARVIDQKLQTIWNGLADHVSIIKNKPGGLDQKMNESWAAILKIMGLPIPIEDELWFSVKENFDPSQIHVPYTKIYIEQDYLFTKNSEDELRVRMKEISGERMYIMTSKREIGGSKREEIERQLTPDQYLKILNEKRSNLHRTIKKWRYCFIYNYQYFELDEIIDYEEYGLPRFKMEFSRTLENQKVLLPPFIPILNDVTGDKNYKTSQMALVH